VLLICLFVEEKEGIKSNVETSVEAPCQQWQAEIIVVITMMMMILVFVLVSVYLCLYANDNARHRYPGRKRTRDYLISD